MRACRLQYHERGGHSHNVGVTTIVTHIVIFDAIIIQLLRICSGVSPRSIPRWFTSVVCRLHLYARITTFRYTPGHVHQRAAGVVTNTADNRCAYTHDPITECGSRPSGLRAFSSERAWCPDRPAPVRPCQERAACETQGADDHDIAIIVVTVWRHPSVRPVLAACIRIILSAVTRLSAPATIPVVSQGKRQPARALTRTEALAIAGRFCGIGERCE